MSYLFRVVRKIAYLFRCYCLRDPFLLNLKKWTSIQGDETLRLDYSLDKSSIVFDVGGYEGDYADAIHQKYGCRVYLFEPVPTFFEKCVDRFINNPSIICLNYGLSLNSGQFLINLDNNASSFKNIGTGDKTQLATIRSISEVVSELGFKKIDLIKINIEGGEYDLLPAIINSRLIKRVKYIQVQFHNFISDAIKNRNSIRESLRRSHREMWNYDFIWESWERL